MADVTKAMERFSEVFPWRTTLALLAASFLAATVVSTVAGHFFIKGETKALTAPLRPGRAAATAAATSNVVIPQPAASLNQSQVDAIVKRNLFNSDGTAEDANSQQNLKQHSNEITKSDLPVKLVGTIYGGDPYSGIALVENSQKRTINSFMVNDTLLKDVTVKEIHQERIIVDHSGHLEYIEVVQQGLSRSRRKKKTAVSSGDQVAPIATEPPPSSYKEDGFERKEREINMTQAYRSKLLTTDFTKVLQDAKATPNMVNGELQGFKLDRIRKDSIWEKSGFQNDDIITEVNGVPLTDTAQAIRLLQSLRNETEIDVRGTRGGAPLKFTLNIH